jgi:hypothetical protein
MNNNKPTSQAIALKLMQAASKLARTNRNQVAIRALRLVQQDRQQIKKGK